MLEAEAGNREREAGLGRYYEFWFVHVGYDQEELKVKGSRVQLDKWVWSPRRKRQIGTSTAHRQEAVHDSLVTEKRQGKEGKEETLRYTAISGVKN